MNLLLHGIGSGAGLAESDAGRADGADVPIPVLVKDGLAAKHGEYELVLTSPPFGKRSSVTIVSDGGETSNESVTINRDDFWATTSNKQLNFLQHVFTILEQHGRGAVVVPDNVLFEGGGPMPDWRKRNDPPRTAQAGRCAHAAAPLDDFVACYPAKDRTQRAESERLKAFTYEELLERDKVNLDLFWLKDDSFENSANLPDPGVLALEITEDLEAALAQFAEVAADLKR